MGVIAFFLIILAVAFGVGVGGRLLSGASTIQLHSNTQLRSKSQSLRTAEVALRRIASGTTGNPVLEAQIALDEIDRKELEAS